MEISVSVAATIISNVAVGKISASGLIHNLPSIFATRTSEIIPLKGISETATAAQAANPTNASGIVFLSDEINDNMICVSAW